MVEIGRCLCAGCVFVRECLGVCEPYEFVKVGFCWIPFEGFFCGMVQIPFRCSAWSKDYIQGSVCVCVFLCLCIKVYV